MFQNWPNGQLRNVRTCAFHKGFLLNYRVQQMTGEWVPCKD